MIKHPTAADVAHRAPRGWRCIVIKDDIGHVIVRAVSTHGTMTVSVKNGVVSGETERGASWVDRVRWRWEGRLSAGGSTP